VRWASHPGGVRGCDHTSKTSACLAGWLAGWLVGWRYLADWMMLASLLAGAGWPAGSGQASFLIPAALKDSSY